MGESRRESTINEDAESVYSFGFLFQHRIGRFELFVILVTEFALDRIFEKPENLDVEIGAASPRGIAYRPIMIIDRSEILELSQANGIKVARDRFWKIDFTIAVGHFNAALGYAPLIECDEGAFPVIYQRGDILAVLIDGKYPRLIHSGDALGCHVRFHIGIYLLHDANLLGSNGCTTVAFDAACAFARRQVTNETFLKQFFRYEGVVYPNHDAKIKSSGLDANRFLNTVVDLREGGRRYPPFSSPGCGMRPKDSDTSRASVHREEARPSACIPPRGEREIKTADRPGNRKFEKFGKVGEVEKVEKVKKDCRGTPKTLRSHPLILSAIWRTFAGRISMHYYS